MKVGFSLPCNTPILYFIKRWWYYLNIVGLFMKTKLLKVLTLSSIGLLLSGCLPSPANPSTSEVPPTVEPTSVEPTASEGPHDEGYYASINDSMMGDVLKNALYDIIHPAMCKTDYGAIWNYIAYSDVGHPESTDTFSNDDILAYYRGTISHRNDMNKEHVWPKSRGGGYIEGDPHMIRPTLQSDNSDRGNSFYVEGMSDDKNGWDPGAAGMNEAYRGDCARIIFYAAVQRKDVLKLVDLSNDSVGNNSMGKLSDLLKWNLKYPVMQSEKNRNDILNGQMVSHNHYLFNFNRNPFIDHPEYACRIWGSTNATTRQICGM